MTEQGTAAVCLISPIRYAARRAWREALDDCVKAAGMQPVDYSRERIEQATSLLAFVPDMGADVLFQAAYAMGRGLRVLLVVPLDTDVSEFDPQPAHVVEIEIGAPDSIAGARQPLIGELKEMARQARPTPTKGVRSSRIFERSAAVTGAFVVTAEQAEALFEEFVADGLSERLIHRLLLEAGCRQSWVDFRLRQHFGGW